ncbi:hypothetical protein ACFV97_24735, partial [Streptomyces sp. NPDC059913]
NPASAFVRAVKGIIDIVTFIVNQGAQIVDFVNAVLDAVIAIANGGTASVPKMVETALATSIPLLIGFLASLLGISGLANKVKSVFHTVAKPVNRAIDKIINLITKAGKKLWNKLKRKSDPKKNKKAGEQGKSNSADYPTPKKNFQSADKENHKVLFDGKSANSDLMVHSTPQGIEQYFKEWDDELKASGEAEGSPSHTALKEAKEKKDEVTSLNRRFRSLSAGADGTQGAYEDLLGSLSRLAGCLAHRPGAAPPLPPPVLPPMTNGVLAQPSTASYINKDIKRGTEANTYDGATLTGWSTAAGYNTTPNRADQNAWVKMHLLPAFLGGDAVDSNLVPARGFVNNPMFLHAVENPARKSLDKPAGDPAYERMVWYEVNVTYFAAHPGFPETIGVKWGGYDHTDGAWKERSPKGSATAAFSDRQDPPAELAKDVLRINARGVKYSVFASLGIGRTEARRVKDEAKKKEFTDLSDAILRLPNLSAELVNADGQKRLRFD